jgi:catechol 2,3-dioxygenase-like lactoylglutathione lyase family enzyme
MKVTGLNHFNIVSNDIEASAAFYEKLGLTRGRRPDFGNTGIWLYIDEEPKVHLNDAADFPDIKPGDYPVHHLGFDVRGSMENVTAWLDGLDIEHRLWPGEVAGWYRALYFFGPSGEQIEFVLKDCYVAEPRLAYSGETLAGTLTIL